MEHTVAASILKAIADNPYVLLRLNEGERPTIEGRLCGLNLQDRTVLLASYDGDRNIPIRSISKITVFGGQ